MHLPLPLPSHALSALLSFRRIRCLSALFVLTLAASCLTAAEFSHPGLLHTATQLDAATDAKARQQVLTLASQLLNEPSEVPAILDIPGYFQDPAVQQAKVRQMQTDTRAAYVCALAFQLTGDLNYASTARRLVLAWVDGNQMVTGYDGPIVMTYQGVGLLLAADLVWDCFTPAEITRLQTWTRHVFYLQAASPELLGHQNNHRTWAIYASLVAAVICHDETLFTQQIAQWKSHVTATVTPDGTLPLELARGDRAGWYTYFALAPMLAAAQVVQNHTGESLWDYHQGAIQRALAYLYTNYANPDRLGAGSAMNPENLFVATRSIYPNAAWANSSYVTSLTPIDASQDQHVAWEFPSLLPATRTPVLPPTPPTSDPEEPTALLLSWLLDASNRVMTTVSAQADDSLLITVNDTSRYAAAKLNSAPLLVLPDSPYQLQLTARRRSGAVVSIALHFRNALGTVTRSPLIQPNLGSWTHYTLTGRIPHDAVTMQVVIKSDVTGSGLTEVTQISIK